MLAKTAQKFPVRGKTTAAGFLNRRPQVQILPGSLHYSSSRKCKKLSQKPEKNTRANSGKTPQNLMHNQERGDFPQSESKAEDGHAAENKFPNFRTRPSKAANVAAICRNLVAGKKTNEESLERRRAKAKRLCFACTRSIFAFKNNHVANSATVGSIAAGTTTTSAADNFAHVRSCLLYTSPSPRDRG